jgi:hypothetical protein
MIPSQPIQVTCPQCGQPYVAQLQSIVDVGEQPELKDELLRGRLNRTTCPYCGAKGMLSIPLLYHDPSKELLLCLMPMELNLTHEDQERLLGAMTNALMDALPPEKRKGYLLQPRTIFSLQRLAEEILEADGVTKEMLAEQTERARLIQDLLDRLDDEEQFHALVAQRREELTYELFLTLAAGLQTAHEDGDEPLAQRLIQLQGKLLELVGPPPSPIPEPLPEDTTYEEMLQTLLEAEGDQQLQGLVIANRPLLDYGFFQALTGQIEAAQSAGEAERAAQLTALRTRVLEITNEIDRQMQADLERAAGRLRRILESDDPRRAIQERIEEIDEVFLMVLSANIAQAGAQGQEEVAKGLEALYDYTLSRLEAQMPPEVQLVNRLLRVESAEAREEILHRETTLVNQEFLDLVHVMAEDARRQRREEIAQRLGEIEAQVERLLGEKKD